MLKLRCEVEIDVISRLSNVFAKLLRFGEVMMANRRIKAFRRCGWVGTEVCRGLKRVEEV